MKLGIGGFSNIGNPNMRVRKFSGNRLPPFGVWLAPPMGQIKKFVETTEISYREFSNMENPNIRVRNVGGNRLPPFEGWTRPTHVLRWAKLLKSLWKRLQRHSGVFEHVEPEYAGLKIQRKPPAPIWGFKPPPPMCQDGPKFKSLWKRLK